MRAQQQPLPSTTRTRGPRPVAPGQVITAAALLALAPMSVPAADIFPPTPPRQIYTEDVSSAGATTALPLGVSVYQWSKGNLPAGGAGSDVSLVSCGSGFWGTHLMHSEGRAAAYAPSSDTTAPTNTRPKLPWTIR